MAAHRIRLVSAWRVLTRAAVDPSRAAPSATVNLPLRRKNLPLESNNSSIELRRSFNRPSNLHERQVVRLCLSGLAPGALAWLNGQRLEFSAGRQQAPIDLEAKSVAIEIGHQLADFNDLTVLIPGFDDSVEPERPLLESVFLEIDPPAI
jgi:hypothetical protein